MQAVAPQAAAGLWVGADHDPPYWSRSKLFRPESRKLGVQAVPPFSSAAAIKRHPQGDQIGTPPRASHHCTSWEPAIHGSDAPVQVSFTLRLPEYRGRILTGPHITSGGEKAR